MEECETVIVVSIGLAVQALLLLGCIVAHFLVLFWAPSSCVCGGWVEGSFVVVVVALL